MADCAIALGGAFDCTALVQGGIRSQLLLYNWEDWKDASMTITETSEVITDIVNGTGLAAYDFSVGDSGNLIPNCALRAIDGGQDGFDHQIDTKLSDLDSASRINAALMRFAKVVAIYMKADGTARLYGEGIGLRLSDWQENDGDAAGGNILQFILKTPDNDPPEAEVPKEIDAGTYADTKTLLDGLSTPGA